MLILWNLFDAFLMEKASGIRSRMQNSMKQALLSAGIKRRATGVGITLVIGLGTAAESNAAGFEILRPHRAVYEIKLKQATDLVGTQMDYLTRLKICLLGRMLCTLLVGFWTTIYLPK